ncbi:MAG: hypothetical protein JWR55_1696 [Aeromicrobium sp.]|nr:hypothetical protein [Aeromicrobium sp.]
MAFVLGIPSLTAAGLYELKTSPASERVPPSSAVLKTLARRAQGRLPALMSIFPEDPVTSRRSLFALAAGGTLLADCGSSGSDSGVPGASTEDSARSTSP